MTIQRQTAVRASLYLVLALAITAAGLVDPMSPIGNAILAPFGIGLRVTSAILCPLELFVCDPPFGNDFLFASALVIQVLTLAGGVALLARVASRLRARSRKD